MDPSAFIITVFCLVDDWLMDRPPLRRLGPSPRLADCELLFIEIVGEFLGLDTDQALLPYFRCHYGEFFPALRKAQHHLRRS